MLYTNSDSFLEKKIKEKIEEKGNLYFPTHEEICSFMDEYADIKMNEILILASENARIGLDNDGDYCVDKQTILETTFPKINLEFCSRSDFAGSSYYMKIDKQDHELGHKEYKFGRNLEQAKKEAVKILSEIYAISIDVSAIEFKWDGKTL